MINENGEILHNGISLTCSNELNFTGIPETWPNNCTELSEKCIVPTMDDSNMIPDPIVGSELSLGGILTLNCNESEALEDGSTSFTTVCKSFETDTDPNYEVKFSADQSEWPKTCTSTNQNSRKKRQIIPILYSYINVIIDVQFNNENVTFEDVR